MRMKILLVDVDSKIPNLALMRLATYFKQQGADVFLQRCGISYYPNKKPKKPILIPAKNYDMTYISTIFKGNLQYLDIQGSGKSFKVGGT